MPKHKLVICLFFLFLTNTGRAQDTVLLNIEQTYNYIKRNIQIREYHTNEIKFNSKRYSLHQPGYFQLFETYYYSFDKRSPQSQNPQLCAVLVREEREEKKYLKEYLFDHLDNFVFYSEKELDGAVVLSEVRVYLHEGKVIKRLQKKGHKNLRESRESSQEAQKLYDKAKFYQGRFKTQFSPLPQSTRN